MDTAISDRATERYGMCLAASRRARWDIDRDVTRGRSFDFGKKFLPDSLARIDGFPFTTSTERRFLSQIQARTYANMLGLFERFIAAKVVELTREHALDDPIVVECLVRFADEKLKHEELFRRIETMTAGQMPPGYRFLPQPDAVANVVLAKSTWAVLGLTCHIELFTLDHFRQSIDGDSDVSELWKDVLLYHMKEESQHAVLDELQWLREDARITLAERDRAVGDLVELIAVVDGILRRQAWADADYFIANAGRALNRPEVEMVRAGLVSAYRWQYIMSGVQNERFISIIGSLLTPSQMQRIVTALRPIVANYRRQT